jgi:hypothetical protein
MKKKFTSMPQCFECEYYINRDDENFYCEAYPKGIPDNILFNGIKHDKILERQTGNYIFKSKLII